MCTNGPRDAQSSARRSRTEGNERDRDTVLDPPSELAHRSVAGTRDERRSTPAGDGSSRLCTDGGTPVELELEPSEGPPGQLSSIFVDVTGTETLVEEQDQSPTARYADDGETPTSETLPEHATAVAKADGLSETLDGPNPSGE